MDDDFELSLSSLPWTVHRGYRLPFSRSNTAFREYFSIGIGGYQFLYSSVHDLLLDIHFRASTGILTFTDQPPGGQFPKYRVSICRLWVLEQFEKFFIVKYTDSFDEASSLVRTFENTADEHVHPQGFGIHRFDPEAGIYVHDSVVSEAVRDAFERPVEPASKRNLVFISCNSKDYPIAERVHAMLTRMARPTFFAQQSLKERGQANFSIEIDRALDDSESLIVVASAPSMFDAPWFDQEWRAWISEYRSGRKAGNVMTILGPEFEIRNLPIALRSFESRTIAALSDGDIKSYF